MIWVFSRHSLFALVPALCPRVPRVLASVFGVCRRVRAPCSCGPEACTDYCRNPPTRRGVTSGEGARADARAVYPATREDRLTPCGPNMFRIVMTGHQEAYKVVNTCTT